MTERKTNVSVRDANVVGLMMFVVVGIVVVAVFTMIWSGDRLMAGFEAIAEFNAFVLLGILFGSIVVHELLHGVGFLMGGLRWRDVQFGVFWQALTPYATSSVPMRARTYRIATALPGVMLGLLPTIAGVALGNGALTFYGAFMLAAAGGDAIVLWVTRHLDGDVMVRDCKGAVGCDVIES